MRPIQHPNNYLPLEPELQALISGQKRGFSILDLKRHTAYNARLVDRVYISRFWSAVEQFNDREKNLLLKFVTSCEREPLLGFSMLTPPFTIQVVPVQSDDERLPTAATCFNTLKLPTYSSTKVTKAKLLYAISSHSGFELS